MATVEDALHALGADSQEYGDEEESEVENSSAGGIKYPVEGKGQEEKGEEVKSFIIGLGYLDGRKAKVCSKEAKEDECS